MMESHFGPKRCCWENPSPGLGVHVTLGTMSCFIIVQIATAQNELPSNDDFNNRILLHGETVDLNISTRGASDESTEPIIHEGGGHSLWWEWTAPFFGQVIISTEGSDFDTLLGVYSGDSLGSLKKIEVNDDADFEADITTSRVEFTAIKGTSYKIVAAGFRDPQSNLSEEGDLILALGQAPPNPAPIWETTDLSSSVSIAIKWVFRKLLQLSGPLPKR